MIPCLVAFGLACNARPTFKKEEIDSARLGEGLPPGFLLGVATSSHQIEGGNENDWTDWEATTFPDGTPHIADGTRSGAAAESYERFDEDLALIQRLGANGYRLSVEWSRIQPSEGAWREEVVDRYLGWVTALRAAGVEPMVTLHHFTLPRWIAAGGGWENDATLDHFEAFVRKLGARLGAQVDLWCPLNEPNVLAVQGYLEGIWPPGKRSNRDAALVLARLLEAHARAARALRESDGVDADGDGRATWIGLAHHVRVFEPASSSSLDWAIGGLTDGFFNESVVEAVRTGRIRLSVPGEIEIDRAVPDLQGSLDWLGINYYTRDHVRADLGDPAFSRQYVPPGRPTNDLGWDLYPEGLYLFLERFAAYGWPLYVTENGVADAGGERRPDFLRAHLYAVHRALANGIDVRGYFHWSLIDNFEWAEGYEPKFGLFRVDFGSDRKTRTPTPAVTTFQEIARNAGLNPRG